MAHESIIFGYIEGATFVGAARNTERYRMLQQRNEKIILSLPTIDTSAHLTRGMFALPDLNDRYVTFRSQVIHFGGSDSGIEFGEVPVWISKFEQLLSTLYWYEAEAHIRTEVFGVHRISWKADRAVRESHATDDPVPTKNWKREDFGTKPAG